MVIETPSGYKVTVRDFVPFGFKRELEKMFYEHFRLKGEDIKKAAGSGTTEGLGGMSIEDISGSVLYEMQEKALRFLVVQIELPSEKEGEAGKVITDKGEIYNTIMGWKEDDGQKVSDAVNKIAGISAEQGKKK